MKSKEERERNEIAARNREIFEKDIRGLMQRKDIQCRLDICKAEFQKAMGLLEHPNKENIQLAYDLVGNLAQEYQYVPAMMWMGNYQEFKLGNLKQAAIWYQRCADAGDGNGARCYADMLMTGNGVERDSKKAMHYYAVAADKGVPEALFVIGEHMRNIGDRENALRAYREALAGGYEPAKIRIDQMKSGER